MSARSIVHPNMETPRGFDCKYITATYKDKQALTNLSMKEKSKKTEDELTAWVDWYLVKGNFEQTKEM